MQGLLRLFELLAAICAMAHSNNTIKATTPKPKCAAIRRFEMFANVKETSYDKYYQTLQFQYSITLADCRKLGIPYRLLAIPLGAFPANSTSYPFKFLTANESLTTVDDMLSRLASREDLPSWFKDTVLIPFYDKFVIGYQSIALCRFGNWTHGDNFFVDMDAFQIVPLSTTCLRISQRIPYMQAAQFYWAFAGWRSFGSWHSGSASGLGAFYPSELAERMHRATTFLLAYFTPLTLAILLFALHVVGRALAATDSHVYYYHKALTITDFLMAIFVCAKETYFIQHVFTGLCLLAPEKFLLLIDKQLPAENDLPPFVVTWPILACACLASTFQAVLAIDRFCAVFCPMHYQRHANIRLVYLVIIACVAINLVSMATELSQDPELNCLLSPGCPPYVGGTNNLNTISTFTAGQSVRFCLLLSSFFVQIICCTCVFGKVLMRHRKSRKIHRNNQDIARKLVPIYLLFGTCLLSLLGLSVEIIFIAQSFFGGCTKREGIQIPCEVWRSMLAFCIRFRINFASAGNSMGLLVHLAVSRHCRTAAKDALMNGLRKASLVCVQLGSPIVKLSRKAKINALEVPKDNGHVAATAET